MRVGIANVKFKLAVEFLTDQVHHINCDACADAKVVNEASGSWKQIALARPEPQRSEWCSQPGEAEHGIWNTRCQSCCSYRG
jgi:hypothetical protein